MPTPVTQEVGAAPAHAHTTAQLPPLRFSLIGTLARDAEVLPRPDGSVEFVVEIQHVPPIVAIEHYPGAEAQHASYIAAKSRAELFRASSLVLVLGQQGIDAHGKWHGRPVWMVRQPLRIAAIDGLDSTEARHA